MTQVLWVEIHSLLLAVTETEKQESSTAVAIDLSRQNVLSVQKNTIS